MIKKIVGLTTLAIGILFVFSSMKNKHEVALWDRECAFCKDDVLDAQAFYEDELVIALCTYKPILPGHCLVIPRRHVQQFDQLTDAEMLQMGKIIKQVNLAAQQVFKTSAYLLLQKNGSEVGQTVPHVHVHYVPRQKDDNSTFRFIAKMFIADFKKPLAPEKMQVIVEKMQEAMQHLSASHLENSIEFTDQISNNSNNRLNDY